MARPERQSFSAPSPVEVPPAYRDRVPARIEWFCIPAPFDHTPLQATEAAQHGQELARGLRVFHDGKDSRPSIRMDDTDLVVETEDFDGGYVSLAFGLGSDVAGAIGKEDLIRASGSLTVEQGNTVFARLNLVSGPTKLSFPFDLDFRTGHWMVEWDILHTEFDADRGRDAWLDIILSQPRDCVMRLSDLNVLRHPRAVF